MMLAVLAAPRPGLAAAMAVMISAGSQEAQRNISYLINPKSLIFNLNLEEKMDMALDKNQYLLKTYEEY